MLLHVLLFYIQKRFLLQASGARIKISDRGDFMSGTTDRYRGSFDIFTPFILLVCKFFMVTVVYLIWKRNRKVLGKYATVTMKSKDSSEANIKRNG